MRAPVVCMWSWLAKIVIGVFLSSSEHRENTSGHEISYLYGMLRSVMHFVMHLQKRNCSAKRKAEAEAASHRPVQFSGCGRTSKCHQADRFLRAPYIGHQRQGRLTKRREAWLTVESGCDQS